MNIISKPSLALTLLWLLVTGLPRPVELLSQCNPSALEVPGNGIDEDCDGLDDFFLNLPPQIYLTVGQSFQIRFQNTILSKHASDYRFEVLTPISGTTTTQTWTITPNAQQIGVFPLTLRVLDAEGNILRSVSTELRIAPALPPGSTPPSRLLLLGHSFLDQGYFPHYLYQSINQAGAPTMSFHGSKQPWSNANARMEGHGGKTWRWFVEDSTSPFFIHRPLNIRAYFNQQIAPNAAPDYIVVYLDVNDFLGYTDLNAANLSSIDDTIRYHWNSYAKPLIDSLRHYAPLSKIGFCTVPPCAGWDEPFDSLASSIPALGNRWRWQKIVNRLHVLLNERYANRTAQGIYIIPTHLNFNALTDYPHNDPVHPRAGILLGQSYGGYNLIAQSVHAWLRNMQLGNTQFSVYFRDQDQDGYGNPNSWQSSSSTPAGYVSNNLDCNDQDATINPAATEICGNQIDENCNGVLNEDITLPIARCKTTKPQLFLSAHGNLQIDPTIINDASTDNCSIMALETVPDTYTCADLGWKTLILRVRDQSGNMDTCHADVFVVDTVAPVIQCKTNTLFLNTNGQASFRLDHAITLLRDNCQLDSATISTNTVEFDCGDKNSTFQYTLNVSDKSGNTASCVFDLKIRAADTDADGSDNCSDLCPTDPLTTTGYIWYLDLDSDGFGAGAAQTGCVPPPNGATSGTDCDDHNVNINPSVAEIPDNAIDENCDGVIDSTSSTHVPQITTLQVMPNPAVHYLQIQSERAITEVICLQSIGQVLLQEKVQHLNQVRFNVESLRPGPYVLLVRFTDGSQSLRSWVKIE